MCVLFVSTCPAQQTWFQCFTPELDFHLSNFKLSYIALYSLYIIIVRHAILCKSDNHTVSTRSLRPLCSERVTPQHITPPLSSGAGRYLNLNIKDNQSYTFTHISAKGTHMDGLSVWLKVRAVCLWERKKQSMICLTLVSVYCLCPWCWPGAWINHLSIAVFQFNNTFIQQSTQCVSYICSLLASLWTLPQARLPAILACRTKDPYQGWTMPEWIKAPLAH